MFVLLLHHKTECKLGSGAPPKGSPKDGPEAPNGVCVQYLAGQMQLKEEGKTTCRDAHMHPGVACLWSKPSLLVGIVAPAAFSNDR
jgi:hypothetical protein